MTCEHQNFHADVAVNRVVQVEGGPPREFVADIRVKCVDCGLPFRWVGVPMGASYDQPMMSVDRHELRAPLEPDTVEAIAKLEGVRGFTIQAPLSGGSEQVH